MNEYDFDEMLELYLEGKLTLQEKAALENHLLSSSETAARLHDLAFVRENLKVLQEGELPKGLHERIMKGVNEVERVTPLASASNIVRIGQSQSLHNDERRLLYAEAAKQYDPRNRIAAMKRFTLAAAALLLFYIGSRAIPDRPIILPDSAAEVSPTAGRAMLNLPVPEQTTLSGRYARGITPASSAFRSFYYRIEWFENTTTSFGEALYGIAQRQGGEEAGGTDFLSNQAEEVSDDLSPALYTLGIIDNSGDAEEQTLLFRYDTNEEDAVESIEVETAWATNDIDRLENINTEAFLEDSLYEGLSLDQGLESTEIEAEIAPAPSLFLPPAMASIAAGGAAEEAEEAEETDTGDLGRSPTEVQNQPRSPDWVLLAPLDLDIQQAINRARDLEIVSAFSGNRLTLFGSYRNLHQLLSEIAPGSTPSWEGSTDTRNWSVLLRTEAENRVSLILVLD
jgi:hypothetical protein